MIDVNWRLLFYLNKKKKINNFNFILEIALIDIFRYIKELC